MEGAAENALRAGPRGQAGGWGLQTLRSGLSGVLCGQALWQDFLKWPPRGGWWICFSSEWSGESFDSYPQLR